MDSFHLGDDIALSFEVTVEVASVKKAIFPLSASGELYKKDKFVGKFDARSHNNRVSGIINGEAIKASGEYVAVFNVLLPDRGKNTHAIPFLIKESVLGKQTQQGSHQLTTANISIEA